MLLELTRWLEQLQSLFGLFNYLTFRFMLSIVTAFALSLWWGPHLIEKLRMLSEGTLVKPIDIFDLLLHSVPLVLLAVRLWRDARRGRG